MGQLTSSQLNFCPIMTNCKDEFVHTHSFFEVFYITLGNITHVCDSTETKLGIGDAYLICPGVYHSFKRKEPCSHRDIIISCDLFEYACNFISDTLYDKIIAKKYIHFKITKESIVYLEQCFNNFLKNGDTILRKEYEKAMAANILSMIFFPQENNDEDTLSFKNKCITELNVNFTSQNALQILRNNLGYNQIYFTRKFKACFNCTPTQYITELRLQHAAYLLTVSDYTLEQCCSKIGLISVPYFINIFKKKYGVTPSRYKQNVKNSANHIYNL